MLRNKFLSFSEAIVSFFAYCEISGYFLIILQVLFVLEGMIFFLLLSRLMSNFRSFLEVMTFFIPRWWVGGRPPLDVLLQFHVPQGASRNHKKRLAPLSRQLRVHSHKRKSAIDMHRQKSLIFAFTSTSALTQIHKLNMKPM